MGLHLKHALLLALAITVFPAAAWTDPDETTKKLLRQPEYPTVQQMLSAYPSLPNESPFGAANSSRISNALARGRAAYVIAAFEYAFPGATFAGLGRDAFPLVDVLDAFYTSIGQPDRAQQVKASTATFSNSTHEQRVALLESVGADFNPDSDAPPFVLFDCTSYSDHSQSTMIVRTAYSEFMRRGGSAGDFVQRFNLVAIHTSQSHGDVIEPGFDLEAFFRKQQSAARNHGRPKSILWVNASAFGYPGSSGSWIGNFWHDTFGSLRTLPSGKVEGTPGRPMLDSSRQQYLMDLADLIVLESKANFREEVVEQAQSFGYDFPLDARATPERLPKLPAKKRVEERAKRALQAMIKVSLEPADGEKLGKDLIDPWLATWMGRAEDNQAIIGVSKAYLEGLHELRRRNWLSIKSYERRLALAITELYEKGLLGEAMDLFGEELSWIWTTESAGASTTLRNWIVEHATADGSMAAKLTQLSSIWSAKDFGTLIAEVIDTNRGTAEFYEIAITYGIERPEITRYPAPWFRKAYRLWWQKSQRNPMPVKDWVVGFSSLSRAIEAGLLPAIRQDEDTKVMIDDLIKQMPRGQEIAEGVTEWLLRTAHLDLDYSADEKLQAFAFKRAILSLREDGADELNLLRAISQKFTVTAGRRYVDYWLETKPSERALRAMIDDPLWDKGRPADEAVRIRLLLLERWLMASEGAISAEERLLTVLREMSTYAHEPAVLRKLGGWSLTQIERFVASQTVGDAFYQKLMQVALEETTGPRNWYVLGLVEASIQNNLRRLAHPHRTVWALRDSEMLGRIAATRLSGARVKERVLGRVEKPECADALDPPAA